MRKQIEFTQGKILSPLLRFALPVVVALILQTMYGAVDLLVIGQFCNAADVSAVSTGSQILQMVTVLVTGLAMGTTVLLGQKLGQGDEDAAGDVIGTSILLFSVVGILITALLVIFAKSFAILTHAPAEALMATVDYVRICGGGALFIVAYNVLGSVFRGIGDSKTPLIAVLIACVVNIILDLLFVAVFDMGVSGVALATVIAQLGSVVISVLIIRKHSLPFTLGKKQMRMQKPVMIKTLRLGAPVALQDFLVSGSFMVIIAIVNVLGVIPSAGVGVAEKLCGFIMLIPSAFMQSISAFVAQNIGAGKPDRAKRAMGYGMVTSFAISLVLAYLGYFHGDMLSSLFSRDAAVIMQSADYLRAYSIDTLLVSFLFCFIGYFNGCGETNFVMIQGIIGAFGIRIPISYLMSRIPDTSLFLIGLATPCSTLVQIVLCVGWMVWMTKRAMKQGAIGIA